MKWLCFGKNSKKPLLRIGYVFLGHLTAYKNPNDLGKNLEEKLFWVDTEADQGDTVQN